MIGPLGYEIRPSIDRPKLRTVSSADSVSEFVNGPIGTVYRGPCASIQRRIGIG